VHALRRLFGLPWLLPLTALLLRAHTVRPSMPFAARELLNVDGMFLYRLASNGLQVAIRHRTPDVVTLGEVFHDHDYVPDAEVERLLGDVRTIVDLGANIGLFGAFAAARWPGASIVAFEPDPENIAVHERTIAANGLEDRWTLVPAAAGAQQGEARFAAGRASLSRLAGEDDAVVIDVPVLDVLAAVGKADLLKMDIEGGEWAILGDPRFRRSPPRVVVLEYHPYRCPTDDPRAAAEAALRQAHMTVRSIKQGDGGHGMLWAWRT
jgi:FkbM family methyltransferase